MACEPFIYVVNQDSPEVPEGGFVPLGQVAHYSCSRCTLSGDAISCKGKGAYVVDVTVTASQADVSSPTAPVLAIELLQNGQAVMGAKAQASSAGTVTLPIHAIIRNDTCNASAISVRNAGPAFSAANVSMTVKPVM